MILKHISKQVKIPNILNGPSQTRSTEIISALINYEPGQFICQTITINCAGLSPYAGFSYEMLVCGIAAAKSGEVSEARSYMG